MKKTEPNNRITAVFLSLLLATELTVLLDVAAVLHGKPLSAKLFAAFFLVVFSGLFFLPFITPRIRKAAAIGLTTAAALVAMLVPCWYAVSQNAVYDAPDQGKSALYGGKNVMLLVPHQDDEINVLGGVLEEYVKYGSRVTVVFSTNGDKNGLAETRMQEAADSLSYIGIPPENVIFLGYGDKWQDGQPHIYNAEPGTVLTSLANRRETYGTAASPAYREGVPYTIDNFLQDIESVILEYRPDILYCVDYDHHIDHRALSLAFEKVMGKILREQSDYRPQVFKGYAYSTAWEAPKDFHSENILSTQNIFTCENPQGQKIYRWEDRTRLPVQPEGLSRSLVTAGLFIPLAKHKSQDAWLQGQGVVSGDKVFWQRYTTSLSYEARIETSSGTAALLQDFMLLECHNLLLDEALPCDGVWIPEDTQKTASFTFDEPEYIDSIVLYDHPDESANVLNARITFDDGTSLETGPLDSGGAATGIPVQKAGVTAFTVTLTEICGNAGLSEVEIFGESPETALPFIKIMDEDENFVYDYWIDPSGSQRFYLYGTTAPEHCLLDWSNDTCSVQWEDGALLVTCPTGKSCVVTVTTEDGSMADRIRIQNPGNLKRLWNMSLLRLEEAVMNACAEQGLHKQLIVYKIYVKASNLVKTLAG